MIFSGLPSLRACAARISVSWLRCSGWGHGGGRGDLQRHVVQHFLDGGVDLGDLGFHQHADLAAHVDVAVHITVLAALIAGEAADGDLLADLGGLLGDHVGHGLVGIQVLLGQKGFDVGGIAGDDLLGDAGDHLLELGGVGHEVGLAVDLDDGAGAALVADIAAHDALGGDAALLLGGLGQALFAQIVDGLFDVAVALGQRLLAIHHAAAGAAAHLSGKIRHFYSSQYVPYSAAVSAAGAGSSSVCSPCLPSSTASASLPAISLTARMASSLPGMT